MAQNELANYWCGQIVECKILRQSEDGYSVTIGKSEIPGLLSSERQHYPGALVLAQFVSAREEHAMLQELSNKHSTYSRLRDALKEEQALTTSLKFKRATDLLVPPVDDVEIRHYQSDTCNFEKLCAELAEQEFTGCIKSFNQHRVSRAGAILHAGRVVGCVYGKKSMNEPPSLQESLSLMMEDAAVPGADIRIYELPHHVVLASAALFLGCPLTRNDSLSPPEYLLQMREWLKQNKQTACFACSLQTTTWLDLHYDGEYAGTFCVEDQKYYRTEKFLVSKLDEQETRIELALLTPEIGEAEGGVGYPLLDPAEKIQ